MRRGEILNSAVEEFLRRGPERGDAQEAEDLAASPSVGEAWPILAEDALHGLAGEIVRAIEPHSEADPVAILAHVLVAFGNMVGRGPFAAVGGARHGSNLFAVCVGRTASRKGTAWADVLHVIRGVDGDWAADRVQGGLSSGEGLIWAVRDAIEETQPVKEKGRVVDTQVVTVDAGIKDKRLLVIEPEIGSTLRVMDREGSSLSGVIRQLWDSGDARIMTKTKAARATGAHVSILGHVTRDELLRYLGRTEQANGFANRFLLLLVRRSKYLPDGGNLLGVNLSAIRGSLSRAVTRARRVGEIKRTPAAAQLWREIYRQLAGDRLGLFGAVTSRAEAQVLRLSVVYALLDGAGDVDVSHLAAALAVWQYAEASARLIFGDALGDGTADEILRALRSAPGGMTRTELSNMFGRHKSADEIGRGLNLLAGAGLIHQQVEETGGRRAERWSSR